MEQIECKELKANSIRANDAKTFWFEHVLPIVSKDSVQLGEIRGLMATITPLEDGRTHFICGWLASGNVWEADHSNLDITYGFSLLNEKGEKITAFYFLSPAVKCNEDRISHHNGSVLDVNYDDIKSVSFEIREGKWKKCK